MNEIENIGHIIGKIQTEIQNNPKFSLLYDYCTKARQDLKKPLRVAITGTIKTGKSTLMNALLGQYIVPTAVEVMTYNVNWFHHVKYTADGSEKLIVHTRDGGSKTYPMCELDSFVGFNAKHKESLDNVYWVDVYMSHPLLEVFDLIDTPGLDSLMGTDSQHTRDLLTKEDNRPDAIIYLVYPEFKSKDIHAVEGFHHATGLISGMNSIAALSRVDMLSGKFPEAEKRINDNKCKHANVRYYFLDIYPIAALLAQASCMIQDSDVILLKDLADTTDIETYTADHDTFVDKFDWQQRNDRERLCSLLSIDGIRHAVIFFQNNPDASLSAFKSHLYKYSNVEMLKSVIIEYFGGRSDFHKCNRVIGGLKKTCAKISQQKELGQESRCMLQRIIQQINTLDFDLHQRYSEYYILVDYYNQEMYFSDKVWEDARLILGEFGKEDVNRLKLPEDATKDEIKQSFDSQYEIWRKRAFKYQLLGNIRANEVSMKITEIIQSRIKNL